MPATLPHLIGDITSALILTYLVSRLTLWLIRGARSAGAWRVPAAHVASWALITVVVGWIQWYSASAGWLCLAPQLFWFVVDKAREA